MYVIEMLGVCGGLPFSESTAARSSIIRVRTGPSIAYNIPFGTLVL